MAELQCIETTLPIGSLEAYRYRVNQIPILTAAEEQQLAKKYHEDGDLEAARKLVMAHLRFVVSIAKNYSGYGLPQADLIQEGNIGLMKAVKRFNPYHGVRLVSFAIHWIKAEIHEFVLKNWRIVKIATTKAQRKLFFNLRKMTKSLKYATSKEVRDIAKKLNVQEKEVLTMESRLHNTDEAFDGEDVESQWNSPAHYLEDHSSNPEQLTILENLTETRKNQLTKALATLDSRSQDILQQRWLNEKKSTLHHLANKYNVSAERVRQIEAQALKQLKLIIKK